MNGPPDSDIAVFTEALRLPPGERDGYLSQACQGDAEFRRRVEALLLAYEQSGDFLGRPAAEMQRKRDQAPPLGDKPGDRIGHYKLLQQIGEGGCGVVYLAEQEEPVRRRVALKIIKPGMDTKNVIARFEAERQALALMDHSNIAHVFDAGATESGRPSFVMELVKGVKLTDYCEQQSLSLDARLELLIQVCDAIQHAHQKGIIHRDIKPSNILVATGPDRKPVPKVIDFGIAKAMTGQQLTDKTIFTAYEMLIGTPAYMSPEQAALSITDVDTRTDIYSLGVLLYELLTGTTPFNTRELLKAGFDEVRRVIRNEEPMRPSTRLSTIMAADPAAFAKHHGEEAPKLIRQMRGELDWIVMKALEKDRTRRYATANGLAMDMNRYLVGEPVLACPPSRLYQFRKLVSRHKLEFAALGIVLTTLVGGLSSTIWSLAKEKKARRDADLASQDALDQRKKAEAGEQKALTALARSQQAFKFMDEMLLGVGPGVANGRDTTLLREIFDKAAERAERELTNQPDVQADLRFTIGNAYGNLGLRDKQEPLLRSALAFYRRTPGAEPKAAEMLFSLALLHSRLIPPKLAEAELEAREALDYAKLAGDENLQVVRMKTLLGLVLHPRGKLAEAEVNFREALAAGRRLGAEKSEELLDARNGLARTLILLDKPGEAEPLLLESLSVAEEKYGTNHLITANCVYLLALLREAQAKPEEAEALYRRCLALRRKLVSWDHPLLEGALNALGGVLQHEKKWEESADVYSELLNLVRKRYGDQDSRVMKTVSFLALALSADGNEVQFEQLGAQFPEAWGTKAEDLARRGRWPEALAAASRLVELRPDDHTGYHMMAPLLVQAGDRKAYQELCAKITTRFAGATDLYIADRMAKDCLILPRPGADLKVPGELAEIAVTHGRGDSSSLPYFQCCKALAEYRQGHWDAAVDWARRVSSGTSNRYALAESSAIMAMAQFQLNQTEPSRASLKKSSDVVQNQLPKAEAETLGGDWRDWIIAQALLTEAKSTIEVK